MLGGEGVRVEWVRELVHSVCALPRSVIVGGLLPVLMCVEQRMMH